jgi:hypothetical protein
MKRALLSGPMRLGHNRVDRLKQVHPGIKAIQRLAAAATVAAAAALLVGCPKTMFFDEGPGEVTDRAAGKAPPGSIGACKVPNTKRPPLVSAELWEHLRECNRRTPRRYLRLGYAVEKGERDERAEKRMAAVMEAVRKASTEKDGNLAMVITLREVRRQALDDPKLASRVERASGRTAACDYAYLLSTTQKGYHDLEGDKCPAEDVANQRLGLPRLHGDRRRG